MDASGKILLKIDIYSWQFAATPVVIDITITVPHDQVNNNKYIIFE